MARVCQVTGKAPMVGHHVSHANNKTKRRFLPNLQRRRFWVESENRWVNLRLTNHALRTIDVATGDAATAHHQRSDVCAVPAAGVVAEAMVAIVLAEAVLEKFGGDALAETRRNLESYLAAIPEGLHTAPGSDAALA